METIPRPPRLEQVRLIRQLLQTPHPALDRIAVRYGPVCGLGAGPLRLVVVGSPRLIRDLLTQPNDRFRYATPLSPFPFVVGTTTMISSDGSDHRRRRGAVQQAFGRRRLSRWIPMIIERTDVAIDDLLDAGDSATPVDMYAVGRRLLIEIVVRALFGERLVAHTAEIDHRFERSQEYLSSPLYRQVPHRLPFTRRAAVRSDRRALDALIDTAIADSRSDRKDRDEIARSGDVLDALVHAGDLSDAEIRDQVKSLIGAGYDTTASTLAWLLWEATTHAELWQRLGDEADTVFGRPGSDVRPDDRSLVALGTANRAMRETLRLHPASGISAREAAVDLTVGPYRIEKGVLVLWSPYLAGRDPDAWAQPDDFVPDRFLDLDDAQRAAADDAWTPFGRGPRMCIGFALAQMELTLIAARLAQRLTLTPTAPHPPPPQGLVVAKPIGGAPMHVARRTVS
jgi:cytochrome P450